MNLNSNSTKSGRATQAPRPTNREWIASIILESAPITRGAISDITGLTAAAVSRITRDLIEIGLALEGEAIKAPNRVGRREFELRVNPEGAYVLGVTITANRRNACLADATGTILEVVDCGDLELSDPEVHLKHLSYRALEMVERSGIDRDRLYGAGISMAVSSGLGGEALDQLIDSDALGWQGVPVKKCLQQHLHLPIIVEHRASALLRGELRSGERGDSVYLVNAALGLGSCASFDGRFLVTGDAGFGAISNFSVPGRTESGADGRMGCLQEIASGKGVIRGLFGELTEPEAQLHQAISMADAGDAAAKATFSDAGALMGQGLNAVGALMAPKLVLIAGEVGRQEDYFNGILSTLKTETNGGTTMAIERSEINSEAAAISVAMRSVAKGIAARIGS